MKARIIADVGNDYQVHVMVIEVDEKTETLQVAMITAGLIYLVIGE